MRLNKLLVTLGLVLSVLLGSGVAVAADFDKGVRAYASGDYKTALAELTPLAEQGGAAAQYNVGYMYDNGEGVLENDKTAVKWYAKAAEQGVAQAQLNLGFMYRNGEGVLENHKTAVIWYTKAAVQGDARAHYNLGVAYFKGTGVLKDTKRAYMWFSLASYNGSEKAAEGKDIVANKMTPAHISKAQDMSSRCLESNYKDC